MPTGTKVDDCYQKLKPTKGESSAAAICQKSTRQSLATGKKLPDHIQKIHNNKK